ncbi:DNA-binding transcriptional regulator, FrmR family [Alteribacillus persepolensis]|uniref:DNA-binding transcriptional regulator, FrmR family n=1 Tax=Alteribacillus persepolensis TaxID=568899 RepID=A0A1G8FWL5_9BACI|nr:metal-sensitive transcriptional regulator [Alteribacillus persepolensis]SDH86460.1 DNA-binding transcriptional regulator, FrmR family [Alteribacillus persepolensis]
MEFDEQVKNRMKRIEGQVRGLSKMIEEEKECRDIVNQVTAVRNALDRTAALMVGQNLEHCIREQQENGENSEQLIKEAVDLLVKSR